jgi:hypothetical protein
MKRYTLPQIKKALIRAVGSGHGHDYNCSAVQGMERDCHCGWLEIKEMVESFKSKRKSK